MTPKKPLVWIVTEGLAGTENQCLGVAECLGDIDLEVMRITLKQPWAALSPWFGFEYHRTFQPFLEPPWPDILISSGRKSIAASRYIGKQSKGKTYRIQIQDPRINPRQFDLVALPAHDPTRGENVVVTTANPNRITPVLLESAKNSFESTLGTWLKSAPPSRIAILIGGNTKSFTIGETDIHNLVQKLRPLQNDHALMITTSRRTGAENTEHLRAALAHPNVYFWDEQSPNPYHAMLAYADVIMATNDSTSMLSEGATTGKPVYVLPFAQLSRRQALLVDNIGKAGGLRPFDGKIEQWSYPPLADSCAIADAIRKKSGLFTN